MTVDVPAGPEDDGTLAPVEFYAPLPLAAGASPAALALARTAVTGQLAFYVGAGVSMSPPTSLPTGLDVQRRVAARARDLLGVEVQSPADDDPTLEELGAAAAALGADVLDQLRELAATAIDFVDAPPNFGHEAIALLLREGLIDVLTVNWDRGIERAGLNLGYTVEPILTQEQRSQGGPHPRIDKLNGCASRPLTLRITREEVDEPLAWAEHRVGAALTDTTMVFLGLGTVGDYVATGVERMLARTRDAPLTVLVVAPHLSAGWRDALGERAEEAHVPERAEPFLDHLLRAAVRLALANARDAAERAAAGGHAASVRLRTGANRLVEALHEHPAAPVWRWWRDGACGTSTGHPFIFDGRGEDALTVVFALVGDTAVTVSGDDDALVVELDGHYLEIGCWPGLQARQLVERQADRIRRRRRRGVYRNPTKRIVSVCTGHRGPLPSAGVSLDIADPQGSPCDIMDGSEHISAQWVAAESYIQGQVVELA
ncbi:MAG: hypothetical protein ACLPZR_05210 [Solirubrobacteraceae bacterium]